MEELITICVIDDDAEYVDIFCEFFEIHSDEFPVPIEIISYVLDSDIDAKISDIITMMFEIDIVVLDFEMPKFSGIDIVRMFTEECLKRYHKAIGAISIPLFIMNTIYKDDVRLCRAAMKIGFQEFIISAKDDVSALMETLMQYAVGKTKEKGILQRVAELEAASVLM